MSEDFGLLYKSTFTGSLVGKGAVVHAVWGFVVANGYGGQVDLHPVLLAATFGEPVEKVEAAILFLCSPDPESRSDSHEGRRLMPLGGTRYDIVNHEVYKSARALEERKAYNRAKQRESRDRKRGTTDVPILDLSKKSLTDADPLLSSPSDLICSDPEGVQGEPPAKPSRFAPADYAPTEAQRARCRERRLDPVTLVADFKRHEFQREYTDWERRFDKWIEDEDEPAALASSVPPSPKGPAWIDEAALLFAREHGQDLRAMAREFAENHHPPPRCLKPGDARTAFKQFLAAKAGRAPAIAAA